MSGLNPCHKVGFYRRIDNHIRHRRVPPVQVGSLAHPYLRHGSCAAEDGPGRRLVQSYAGCSFNGSIRMDNLQAGSAMPVDEHRHLATGDAHRPLRDLHETSFFDGSAGASAATAAEAAATGGLSGPNSSSLSSPAKTIPALVPAPASLLSSPPSRIPVAAPIAAGAGRT